MDWCQTGRSRDISNDSLSLIRTYFSTSFLYCMGVSQTTLASPELEREVVARGHDFPQLKQSHASQLIVGGSVGFARKYLFQEGYRASRKESARF